MPRDPRTGTSGSVWGLVGRPQEETHGRTSASKSLLALATVLILRCRVGSGGNGPWRRGSKRWEVHMAEFHGATDMNREAVSMHWFGNLSKVK